MSGTGCEVQDIPPNVLLMIESAEREHHNLLLLLGCEELSEHLAEDSQALLHGLFSARERRAHVVEPLEQNN